MRNLFCTIAVVLAVAFVLLLAGCSNVKLKGTGSFWRMLDAQKSLMKTKSSAEKGDAQAQFNLGVMYDRGQGVAQNYVEAIKWYSKAADQNEVGAQFMLGRMHHEGRGIIQDYNKAAKWYQMAAEYGNDKAQYYLGTMHHIGEGVSIDLKEAEKWYRLAANQGHNTAQYALSVLDTQKLKQASSQTPLNGVANTTQSPPKPTYDPAQTKDTIAPSIQIASSITVKEDSPTIRGKVTDTNNVVRVTVNGVASTLFGNAFSFTLYVPLSGITAQIEAIDEWGNSSQKNVRLTRSEIQTASVSFDALNPTGFSSKPNKDAVALIIGVADYKRVADAKYADRDAEFFSDYARRKLGVPAANIKVLTNDNADFADIIEAANVWLPRATKANRSDVYLFFAGHGLGSDDGNELYLLPHSGMPQLLNRTSILRSDLFKSIADAKPRSVTVFLDTCYSGTSRTDEALLASRPILLSPKQQDVPSGFTLISAAGMDQTAKLLPEVEHGLFSYWLMKGMEGPADNNNDQKITAGELHQYVQANVSRIQRNQTPELQGDAERVLVRW